MPCVVRASTTSAAPPAAVFALLADVSTWSRWGRWERAELESEAPGGGGGVGAVRRLTSRTFGQTIVSRERVEAVVPHERIVYALLSGLPLVGYRGEIALAPTPTGGTALTWSSSFEPKWWGTGWFYRAVLQRFIAETAVAVARAAERGP